MKICAYTVSLALSFWFVLIVLNQFSLERFPRLRDVLKHDRLHLLPKWNFFAPNPGTIDYHMYARGFDANGIPDDWNERYPVDERPWTTILWNPSKRYRKAIMDLVQIANQLTQAGEDRATVLMLSVPYIAFLNAASGYYKSLGRSACQFAIIRTEGKFVTREGELVFRSNVHPC